MNTFAQLYSKNKIPQQDIQTLKPEQSIILPQDGAETGSKEVENIGRVYQIYDVGKDVVLSSEANNIKAHIASRYYRGNLDMPANYLFENFAKNNVSETQQIVDMWETMWPEIRDFYPDLLEDNRIKTILQFTDAEGKKTKDTTLSTYQYIDALATVLGRATGIEEIRSQTYGVRKLGMIKPKSARKYVDPPVTASSRSTLPSWGEVSQHMSTVFRDSTFEGSVKEFFNNPNKKMTNNHLRMLRAMHRTYPIGMGYTFDQWMQALKLIYQTNAYLGVSPQQSYSGERSPYFQYPSNTPRLAKYRD